MLDRAEDPEREYVTRVLPEKIRLAKEYVRRSSLWFDLTIAATTALLLAWDMLPWAKRAEKQVEGSRRGN